MEEKEGENPDAKIKELVERYRINLEKLKEEQEKLAKTIVIKDAIDFSFAQRIAGIENIFVKNKIISAIVVLVNGEVTEQEYFEDKIRFPYIPGFRAYRELPTMIAAFNKLDEKPEVVFIHGNGILHPRGLGLASHFSIAAGVPTIGVSDSYFGKIDREDIKINGKISGRVISTKEGANPIYVSPGNMISLSSAERLVRKFIKEPHKMPEPLRLAKRYSKEVCKEIVRI